MTARNVGVHLSNSGSTGGNKGCQGTHVINEINQGGLLHDTMGLKKVKQNCTRGEFQWNKRGGLTVPTETTGQPEKTFRENGGGEEGTGNACARLLQNSGGEL